MQGSTVLKIFCSSLQDSVPEFGLQGPLHSNRTILHVNRQPLNLAQPKWILGFFDLKTLECCCCCCCLVLQEPIDPKH